METIKIRSYKDLRIWQEAMTAVESLYALTEKFPKSEEDGLKTQIRRAVVSIPSNIAEGFRRNHKREYR